MSARGALAVMAALGALALAPSAEGAVRSCGTFGSAGGDVIRVYALRGVSCKKALDVARVVAQTNPPSPWHCLTGIGQRYRGKAISFACGYGSRGPVMKRAHAFVAVQAHTSG
jgi:hypothetical protein